MKTYISPKTRMITLDTLAFLMGGSVGVETDKDLGNEVGDVEQFARRKEGVWTWIADEEE